jgi:hypothetical protein
MGKAQSRAKQPSAAAQGVPSDAGVKRRTHENWKLAWLSHNRAEYGEDIRRAVLTQSYHRGRRKVAISGINDRPAGSKWNPVRPGNPGCNVGFGIDRERPCLGVKLALFQSSRDWCIHSGNFRVDRAGKRLEKSPGPYWIRRKKFLAGPDRRPDDPIAGSEIRRQSAGNAEADDARSTTLDRRLESSNELHALTADHRNSRA